MGVVLRCYGFVVLRGCGVSVLRFCGILAATPGIEIVLISVSL